jgi:hypothetical protein
MKHNPETYRRLELREGLRWALGEITCEKFQGWWQTENAYLRLEPWVHFLRVNFLPWEQKRSDVFLEDELAVKENEKQAFLDFIQIFESLIEEHEPTDRYEFALVKDPEWGNFIIKANAYRAILEQNFENRAHGDVRCFRITVGYSTDLWTPGRNRDYLRAIDLIFNLYDSATYPVWYPSTPNSNLPVRSLSEVRAYITNPDREPSSSYFAYAADESHSVSIGLEEADGFVEFDLFDSEVHRLLQFLESLDIPRYEIHQWVDGGNLVPYE